MITLNEGLFAVMTNFEIKEGPQEGEFHKELLLYADNEVMAFETSKYHELKKMLVELEDYDLKNIHEHLNSDHKFLTTWDFGNLKINRK